MKKYQKTYVYTKLRKHFGRQPLFQNVAGHILDSIYPDVKLQREYTLRNPVNRQVQAIPAQCAHEANTKQVVVREQSVNHEEGGWPRDVHPYNEEHVARHRRRVQHEENYIHAVMGLKPQIEHNIYQNNAIEMYQAYFAEMQPQAAVEKYNIQISNIFRDPNNRPVTSIVWTNERKSKLVASYCFKSYPTANDGDVDNTCYMWDLNKETEPIHKFNPEHGCWNLDCSPVDPEIIIAGLDTGIAKVFDIRAGETAVSSSSIYNSHRAPITSILYTTSRTNTEFFTGSPDGQCLWWDTRNLTQPIDRLTMSLKFAADETPHLGNAEGISCFEFDRGFPTKFLAGTESGLIINVNRMGRSHSEILSSHWEAHTGSVRSVQRSPCTLRMFISCGDFSVRIWSEEVRTAPIIVTKPYRHQVTDVAWAPLRYSSFMVASENGMFHYWDLLRKYREPVATLQVSKTGLSKVSPHPRGKTVAVGDSNGCISLLNLSENMIIPGANDKQLMNLTYERETRREHILDMRLKEMKLKLRTEVEEVIVVSLDEEKIDGKDLEEESSRYFQIVNKELGQFDQRSGLSNLSLV